MSLIQKSQHPCLRPTILTLLAFLFLLSALAACAPQPPLPAPTAPVPAGELASVLKKGILVISTDADYPPQSLLKKDLPRTPGSRCDLTHYTAGQLEGFDIEVAVEIARRLGVEPCFVTPSWSQVAAGTWGDRWDINVGSMAITAERARQLYFTQPYISGQAVAFVHKENRSFQSPADLSGRRIGVCTGCAYEAYLRGTLDIPGAKLNYEIKNAHVVGYDTDTSALADLALGDGLHLDAVLTDPDTGASTIASGLPLRQLPGTVYNDFSAVALDKRSVSDALPLVRRISAIIQEMHRDGSLLALSQKYYGGDFSSPAAAYDLEVLGQLP